MNMAHEARRVKARLACFLFLVDEALAGLDDTPGRPMAGERLCKLGMVAGLVVLVVLMLAGVV